MADLLSLVVDRWKKDFKGISALEIADMLDTLMAFPSRSVLEDAFHKDRVDYGVFTNRMHLGDGHIQLYYFKREVLDRYLKDPEKYEVDDDATGGDVRMTSNYFMSLSD